MSLGRIVALVTTGTILGAALIEKIVDVHEGNQRHELLMKEREIDLESMKRRHSNPNKEK